MSASGVKRFDYEASKLRRAMVDAGLDSRALAARAGVNRRSLQNLLSGCYRGWPIRDKLNKFFKTLVFDPAFNRPRGRPRKPKILATHETHDLKTR